MEDLDNRQTLDILRAVRGECEAQRDYMQQRIDTLNRKIELMAERALKCADGEYLPSGMSAYMNDYGYVYANWTEDPKLWEWYNVPTDGYSKKIRLIKAVREVTGLGLADSKRAVEDWYGPKGETIF